MSFSESTRTDRLLQAVSDGDESALGELIRLHLPYLRRIIELRIAPELKSRVDTSDVLQETQMVIIRRVSEFISKRPASFRVWLRSRAIEQLVDQYRRHVGADKRSVRRERDLSNVSSMAIARTLLSETPSKVMQKRELAEQVCDLIESLREIDREVLTLRHAEGLTNNEVAEALNIDPVTARKRYGRALRRLVEMVTAAGLDASLSWGATK
ncbi:MAG: sigma-70 family RNA polymerase sigma factor [Planctomycetales bacterium]|nr:sigma-70 family RNA polymerase sigma factor [Planctomycetales bacterium]